MIVLAGAIQGNTIIVENDSIIMMEKRCYDNLDCPYKKIDWNKYV